MLCSGCGNDRPEEGPVQNQETEAQDSIRVIEGEFIFLSEAAVLKGPDFIYGVKVDSVSRDLAKQVAGMKENEFEMIPVKVEAKIIPNPSPKGWEEYIEIRKIIEVSEEKAPDSALVK